MTFKTTITDPAGIGIPDLWVTANDLVTGAVYGRSTDGGGYADVACLGAPVGNRITFTVVDPQHRYIGFVHGDAMEVSTADQELRYTLAPFV